jgi:hypothetical protein
MTLDPTQDAKPTNRRQSGQRPLAGWGSPLSGLAAGRPARCKVSLPVLKFLSDDDEGQRHKT